MKSKKEDLDVLFVDNRICLEIMSLMQRTYNYASLLIMCLVDKSIFSFYNLVFIQKYLHKIQLPF